MSTTRRAFRVWPALDAVGAERGLQPGHVCGRAQGGVDLHSAGERIPRLAPVAGVDEVHSGRLQRLGRQQGPAGVPSTDQKRMCRCTCRSLTAPAVQEHHSQETAGLDISPATVLRCQGHPGSAAGPRSPPQRGPAAGARGISVRLHRPGPGAGRTGRRRPGRAATPGHHLSGIAAGYIGGGQPTGLGRAHPDAGQQDPRTHTAPRPATLSGSAATASSRRSAPAPHSRLHADRYMTA